MLFFPRPLSRQLRGVCFIECESRYAIAVPGGDTLRLVLADSVSESQEQGGKPGGNALLLPVSGSTLAADSAKLHGNATGFFVSPEGHAITSAAVVHGLPLTIGGEALRRNLEQKRGQLHALREVLKQQEQELDYYHLRHSVTDEGYTQVENRREFVKKRLERLNRLLEGCDKVLNDSSDATATLECDITMDFREKPGSGQVASHRFRGKVCGMAEGLLLVQPPGRTLPDGAVRFCPYWLPTRYWIPPFVARRILGFPLADKGVRPDKGTQPDVLPADTSLAELWPEGAPVADAFGHLDGVVVGGRIVAGNAINRILETEGNFPTRFFRHIAGSIKNFFYGRESGMSVSKQMADSIPQNIRAYWLTDTLVRKATLPNGTYVGQWKDNQPAGTGCMLYTDGNLYCGYWKAGMRWGYGTTTTPQGACYTGYWEGDSLSEGVLTDSVGKYEGGFGKALECQGYGIRQWWNEDRYEGEWVDGQRQGFGFFIGTTDVVKCGIWKRDKFSGEEMDFTRNRIYGIDISRYQHESGRKKYRIDWNRLRITRLGTKGKKATRGPVDYPVSFVYVKATQGTTIKSAYYAADAAAARKKGIPVGAYHFFSPKSGREQAGYFLKMAAPRTGDLPPMLDVELTDAQIAAMGGAKAMFREMKIWMQTVEARCAVRPILYVSQQFVNRYLSNAPTEWKEYDVWVARYGEYKPYVHLLYWQLSPYGRVAGIHGNVDVNVYNGTQEQFHEYIKGHRVGTKHAAGS